MPFRAWLCRVGNQKETKHIAETTQTADQVQPDEFQGIAKYKGLQPCSENYLLM